MTESSEEITSESFNDLFDKSKDQYVFLNQGGYEKDREPSKAVTIDNCKFKRVNSGYCTPTHQTIYLFYEKNTIPNHPHRWDPNRSDRDLYGWNFVSCDTDKGFKEKKAAVCRQHKVTLIADADFYERLAKEAVAEVWDFRYPSEENKPLLRNYIQYMLKRLGEENKILESQDGSKIIFNTGLFSRFFDPILVQADKIEKNFYKNPDIAGGSRSSLEKFRFLKHSVQGNPSPQDYVTKREDVPFASFYDDDVSKLVFDPNLEIVIESDFRSHIFADPEHRARFHLPDPNITDLELFDKLKTSTEKAQKVAKRNYKLVVPQWSFEHGCIQFLMPMYWDEFAGEPFCALVLDLREGLQGNYYEAKTIFTLDDCYQNARLIAKPDNTWLIPEAIEQV